MAHFHKVNATYHAPEGDSKVVEMGLFPGVTFFDGVPIDVICTLDQQRTLENNKHFQINSSSDYDPGDVPPDPPATRSGGKDDPKAERGSQHDPQPKEKR